MLSDSAVLREPEIGAVPKYNDPHKNCLLVRMLAGLSVDVFQFDTFCCKAFKKTVAGE